MSELVERNNGIYCDCCDELIGRGTLSIYDLMKRGGMIVQILEPVKHEAMMMGSMGTTQTITSVDDRIACSKECAEKLLAKMTRKKRDMISPLFVALSGQELRRLGETIDAKAYIGQAWDGSRKQLATWFSGIGSGRVLPTTYDAHAALLAPEEKKPLTLKAKDEK